MNSHKKLKVQVTKMISIFCIITYKQKIDSKYTKFCLKFWSNLSNFNSIKLGGWFLFKSKHVTSQYIHTIRDHYIQDVELKTGIDSTRFH